MAIKENKNFAESRNRLADIKKVDTKELEYPETVFVSDIDAKIFQGIVIECLSQIEGIELADSGFINNILGRTGPEVGCGVHSEKDSKNQSVSIKIVVNIRYGLSIPEKAEEIQSIVVKKINQLTGLHVSSLQIVFENIISPHQPMKPASPADYNTQHEGDYSEEF